MLHWLVVDVGVGILVGIASNFATDWVRLQLASTVPPPGLANRSGRTGNALTTVLLVGAPVAVLAVARERWVLTPPATLLLVVAAFVAAVASAWGARITTRVVARRHKAVGLVWSLPLIVSAGILDVALPRQIALDCPQSPVANPVTLTGRVLRHTRTIALDYRPIDDASSHTFVVPIAGGDGRWSASLKFDGAPGIAWSVVVRDPDGRRSKECTVQVE